MPPTQQPDPGPDMRLVLRDLCALILVVLGVVAVVVGAFIADPGAGIAASGAVAVGAGYLLGRK